MRWARLWSSMTPIKPRWRIVMLQIEKVLERLRGTAARPAGPLPPARHRNATANAPAFRCPGRPACGPRCGPDADPRAGPSLALKLVGECGTDLSAWPNAKHFTSWLCLAPGNKISGGKVLSTRTRRSGSRAAALLRLAAVTVGRTQTALGAFYRRLSARVGKAKGGHGDRPKDSDAVLQHVASWNELRRPWRLILRGEISRPRPRQPATAREVSRIRPATAANPNIGVSQEVSPRSWRQLRARRRLTATR